MSLLLILMFMLVVNVIMLVLTFHIYFYYLFIDLIIYIWSNNIRNILYCFWLFMYRYYWIIYYLLFDLMQLSPILLNISYLFVVLLCAIIYYECESYMFIWTRDNIHIHTMNLIMIHHEWCVNHIYFRYLFLYLWFIISLFIFEAIIFSLVAIVLN